MARKKKKNVSKEKKLSQIQCKERRKKRIRRIICLVNKSMIYTHAFKIDKCPSTDEWIKKMWHIYIMEYYSAIKRNEIVICSEVDGPRVLSYRVK